MLTIRTFGGCSLEREGARLDMLSGQRKPLAFLALVAASGERGISRDQVLSYLWPESDEERARASLKQLVHSLRTQLRSPELLLPSAELRLNPAVVESDVGRFRDAVARGDDDAAAALYVGAFLDGFYLKNAGDFDAWVASERGSLAHIAARVMERLAEQAASRGETRAAVEWWRRLANADPLSARAATGLIMALDAAGERAAALQHARVYETLVRNEVGVGPDPLVAETVSRLQRGEPAAVRIPPDSANTPTTARSIESTSNDQSRIAPSASHAIDANSTRRRRLAVIIPAISLLLLAPAAYRAWSNRSSATTDVAPTRVTIAVLPFANTSGDPSNEPFTDGLTDELIGTLGKISGLSVSGRTSSFSLKGKGLSVRAIADTLGVEAVLEGSVRREGSRLKVFAELVNARDGMVVWTETYDRELVTAFDVQGEISRAIVDALRVELIGQNDRAFSKRPTSDPVAYDFYLRGRYIWWARYGREGTLEAARYFEQAIARDSTYARAYAGLSDAHARLAVFGYGEPHAEFAKAKAAAQRALALDSTNAEAHASLGHVLLVHDFDWSGSEREFRRALALDPSYTLARNVFAIGLSSQGRFAEALATLDTALVADPLAPSISQVRGRVHVSLHQPDSAIRYLKSALELNPSLDLSYQQLGHAYLQKRMYKEAIAALRHAAALSGIRDSAQLAYAYAVAGRPDEARRIVRSLVGASQRRYVLPYHIAMAYTGLGDLNEAFRWLERGYEDRASFMNGIKAETAFERLHADPRWRALLARMRLPQ